ncbi:MAG TPA: hypothetical protein VFK05_29910 [Polyangiaceae bacterium]|nr:hypothetical protein [Polyangiaceae bacterium]
MASKQRQSVHVTIVASSAETLDGLQTYLSLAGLAARGTRQLADFGREPCTAVVLFPDEFSAKDVLRELARLRREQPRVLCLLVTSEPLRYADAAGVKGAGLAPIVIPKPAWGWTILDAIRLGAEPRSGESEAVPGSRAT